MSAHAMEKKTLPGRCRFFYGFFSSVLTLGTGMKAIQGLLHGQSSCDSSSDLINLHSILGQNQSSSTGAAGMGCLVKPRGCEQGCPGARWVVERSNQTHTLRGGGLRSTSSLDKWCRWAHQSTPGLSLASPRPSLLIWKRTSAEGVLECCPFPCPKPRVISLKRCSPLLFFFLVRTLTVRSLS